MDACAIVRWHAQETRTINALLKYLTHSKNILKIYRTFLSAINFFSLFRFRATSCTLRWFFRFCSMHLDARRIFNFSIPPLTQAYFSCAFLISSNLYFQHKRGRLRYRASRHQEANAIYKLIHIKNPPHFFSVRWMFPLFFRFRATSCSLRWFFRFCSVHLDARRVFNLSIYPC